MSDRAEQVANNERLLARLKICARWHEQSAKAAKEGVISLTDPLLRFAWTKMAEEHEKQANEIHSIVNDLLYAL